MNTFVVRVYRTGEDIHPDEQLRGMVEEIATGLEATFRDARELVNVLGRQRPTIARAPQ